MNKFILITLATALGAAAGCFKEPRPAYTHVPAETQVYLKNAGLTTLTADDVFAKGLVFLDDRAEGAADRYALPEGAEPDGGHYTNLSARVSSLDPTTLTYLNLDYNELSNVDAVAAFTGLKWLRLNDNRLATLPDLASLANLRRIYLRNNQLTAVPEAFKPGNLPALESIDFSGNPIAVVPDWLAQREGLVHLSFTNTGITKLPADLSAWKSLKSLQLGGLHLESLDELRRIRTALPTTAVVF